MHGHGVYTKAIYSVASPGFGARGGRAQVDRRGAEGAEGGGVEGGVPSPEKF